MFIYSRRERIINYINDYTTTVAFVDDMISGGKIKDLQKWWELLSSYGPQSGYYPQSHKSWLVVKGVYRLSTERQFHKISINIITPGKLHLGAAIGDEIYCQQEYCKEKVKEW